MQRTTYLPRLHRIAPLGRLRTMILHAIEKHSHRRDYDILLSLPPERLRDIGLSRHDIDVARQKTRAGLFY